MSSILKSAKLSPAMVAGMWDVKRGFWHYVKPRTMKALISRGLVQVERRQVEPDRIYTNGVKFDRTFTPEGDAWIFEAMDALRDEALTIDLDESNAATRRWVAKFNGSIITGTPSELIATLHRAAGQYHAGVEVELFESINGTERSAGRYESGRKVIAALNAEYGVRFQDMLNADNPYPLIDRNADSGRTTAFQGYSYRWAPVAA